MKEILQTHMGTIISSLLIIVFTFVVAIIVVIMAIVAAATRNKKEHADGHIEIKKLNESVDNLRDSLKQSLMTPALLKQTQKEKKAALEALEKATEAFEVENPAID